jgi:hypothetical protein
MVTTNQLERLVRIGSRAVLSTEHRVSVSPDPPEARTDLGVSRQSQEDRVLLR